MSDIRLPAIPQPTNSIDSLLTSVTALKQAIEMLTGATAAGTATVPSALEKALGTSVVNNYIDAINQSIDDLTDYINNEVDNAINTVESLLNQEITNRESADVVLQTQINGLTSQVNDNVAAISEESLTRASADSALSAQITTLSSTVSDNTAAIQQEAITRAAADGSLSADITSVQAQSNAGTANGKYQLVAVSANDGAAAEFSVKVSADGAAYAEAGMRLQVFSNGTSRVVFDTSQFIVRSGVGTAKVPFAISGSDLIANALLVPNSNVTGLGAFATLAKLTPGNSATYIETAAIKDAFIDTVSATKVSVAELSAFTANLGTVTAGLARDSASKFIIDFNNARLTVYD